MFKKDEWKDLLVNFSQHKKVLSPSVLVLNFIDIITFFFFITYVIILFIFFFNFLLMYI